MTKLEIQEVQKKALAQIEIEVQEAYNSLNRATKLADDNGVSFCFSPAYGMGGSYEPDTSHSLLGKPDDGEEEDVYDVYYADEPGWQASSQSC